MNLRYMTSGRLFVLLAVGSLMVGANGTRASQPPDLPEAILFEGGEVEVLASRLQKGVLGYYYWEDATGTHRSYGGAFKPGYVVPWPKSKTASSRILRFRLTRPLPPTVDWQLSAWRRVSKENGFPTGKRIGFPCRLGRPTERCRWEPSTNGTQLSWDAIVTVPRGGRYYFSLIPAWFNYEEGQLSQIQEAQWLFQVLVESDGTDP